ncbi:hypothetical protein P280DRAFT_474688 [Massarina eburnea CBS 473.64]|uniref:Uncharacterized protein n=1 Tax=Massarina eburnea CBS 473.64 TaxID=1395130 RepID=A0A6A6RH56_9PLEO|nr:hypothetical protein P280DRAFT_474688 [Massarina eburnea CBS 473.64]
MHHPSLPINPAQPSHYSATQGAMVAIPSFSASHQVRASPNRQNTNTNPIRHSLYSLNEHTTSLHTYYYRVCTSRDT